MIGQGRDDVISVFFKNTYQGVYKTLQIMAKDRWLSKIWKIEGMFLEIAVFTESRMLFLHILRRFCIQKIVKRKTD